MAVRHLNSLFDLTADEIREILGLAHRLKEGLQRGERPPGIAGYVLTQLFEKPSLRTRVSFEAAMMQLGGSSIFLTAKDAGLHGRESLSDIARVLSGYSDVIVLRTFSQQLINDFAAVSQCPVINGLSDERHPCQALTDLFTIQEVFGDVEGRKLVYVGDGNNVASSLAIAAAKLGMAMVVCAPPTHRLQPEFVAELREQIPTADFTETCDLPAAVCDASIIYTDVWTSMGQEEQAEERKRIFAPYQVNAELMSAAPPECRFMHCLPARRGLEVTDDVMDGPQCIAFLQAENRMHLAKGLIVWLLEAYDAVPPPSPTGRGLG